jgi:signal transduction histidine kinase
MENVQYCGVIVDELKSLLLYTHIPAAAIILLLGFFVFFKNRTSTLSKILLAISISFALWVTLNLGYGNSNLLMAAWAPIEAVKVLIFFLCWYFTYVFFENKDLSRSQKWLWLILLTSIFAISMSNFNLIGFNAPECIAMENTVFSNITFWVEVLLSVLLLGFVIKRLFNNDASERKKAKLIGLGVITFVVSFFVLGQISESTLNYSYEAYGLFGMVVFVTCLGYLIYKYSLFNIKLFAAQLLVVALLVLTASQLTFASGYGFILALVTTILSCAFGYLLIKSVRIEVEQRERLQQLSISLANANEKLKGLDKLKTEFLSLASHQLRSPLTAIKGYASMLVEGSFGKLVDQKQDEAVRRIYASAQGLANIVEDLLNVSKIEQGGMKYEMMPTDMVPLVTQLYNEMSIPATNKGLAFTLEMTPNEKFEATIDPLKMKQVFLNLTDNSIKYTQKGFVKLILKREGKNITFAVSDSGAGISPETKAKLFEKFSRGEGGKMNTGGSGLGLYLAREITRAHKGDIVIESEGLGKGSTFKVVIPVA